MAEDWRGSYYAELVERSLFVESVDDVRAAIRSAPVLDHDDLEAAFDAAEQRCLDGERTAEYELVRFVRAVVEDTVSPAAHTDDPIDRARAAGGVFAAWEILRTHAGQFTLADFDALQSALFDRPPWQTSRDFDRGLEAMCALAVVLRDEGALGRALAFWGAHCREAGRLDAAARRFARAQVLAERDGDPFAILAAAGGVVSVAELRGDLETTISALGALIESSQAADQPEAVSSYRRKLTGILMDAGRYSEALELLDAELEFLGEPDHPAVAEFAARVRLRKGLVLEDLGRYEQGEAEYERARELAQFAGARDLEFQALNNTAASALKRGDARTGVERFRRVFQTVRSWGSPGAIAATHNNLGHAYRQDNRPGDALLEYGRALELKLQYGDRPGELIAYTGMAAALEDLGHGDEAASFWTLVLATATELGDLTSAGSAATTLSTDEEPMLETLELVRRAAIERGELMPEILVTRTLVSAAVKRGDVEQAITLSRDTLSRIERSDERSPVGIALTVSLGRLEAGYPDTRLEGYRRLREAAAYVDAQMAQTRLDERRSEIAGAFLDVYAALIDTLVTDGAHLPVAAPVQDAFQLHEAAKGRSFVASLADADVAIPDAVPDALRERERELLAIERGLQEHHLPSDTPRPTVFRQRRLHEVQDELERCWSEMAATAPDYVRLRRGDPIALGDLRRTLAAAADGPVALVSFFCGQDSTTAFVIRSDHDAVQAFPCAVGRQRLEDAARALRRSFNGDPTAFPPYPPIRRDRPERRSLAAFEDLAPELLSFLPAVADMELLCIAPHGPLHLLPLHALRTPDGGLVGDRHAVVYVPSATSLAYIVRTADELAGGDLSAYVAGTAAREDAHTEFFETDAELFRDPSWSVRTAVGGAATPADVLAGLTGSDVAHITCHGVFDERRPLRSGLLLGDAGERPPRDPRSLALMERRRFVLTAEQVLRSPMRARLVTLRACSTGMQGERNHGDELDGLTRSLLYAGCSSVIVSLWNVDQESSRTLIQTFYERWRAAPERGKWRALWDAQRALQSDDTQPFLRHPYHWAPLVLVGDWR